MPRLTWDEAGKHFYETGVSNGVLYLFAEGKYATAVAWNGLTKVSENPSGGEPTALYADNIKYLNIMSAEEFAANISCYAFPDEFALCLGQEELVAGMSIGQQDHSTFGFCYKTLIGNDTDKNNHGYKLHVVYGCTAAPISKDRETVNESPSAVEMSFDVSTVPVTFTLDGKTRTTATLEFDSTKLSEAQMKAVEDALYGTAEKAASLPMPEELVALIKAAAA